MVSVEIHYENITKTRLFNYVENFTSKNGKFRKLIFHIFAQNIDCGYSLEPAWRGGSNDYPQSFFFFEQKEKNDVYRCKLQFYYVRVGFKGSHNYIGMFLLFNILLLIATKKKTENIPRLPCLH